MTLEARLQELEARLLAAEDRLAILNLLSEYGPLADSGMADAAADLWCENGGYSFSDPSGTGDLRLSAPEPLASMLRTDAHIAMVQSGSGHLTAVPTITVSGDTAEAVGYTFVVRRNDLGWFVWRAAVNHWTFARTAAGWRVAEKINRALDGSPASREIMWRVSGMA